MPYWYQQDMEGLVGKQAVQNILSDGNKGYVDAATLAEFQTLSDGEVDSALATEYPTLGLPIIQNFPAWTALTGYAQGTMVQQVTPAAPVPALLAFRAITPGVNGTSGATEPTWPTLRTGTVTDGTVSWLCISAVPEKVRMASLLVGKALLFERHPDYVRRYGTKPREVADKYLRDIVSAKAYFENLLGNLKPANVGGAVVDRGPRIYVDGPQGQKNSGDY